MKTSNFVERLRIQKSQTMPTRQSESEQKFHSNSIKYKRIDYVKTFKQQHSDLKQLLFILQQKKNTESQHNVSKACQKQAKKSGQIILTNENISNHSALKKQNMNKFMLQNKDKTAKKDAMNLQRRIFADQFSFESPKKSNLANKKPMVIHSQKIIKEKQKTNPEQAKFYNDSFINFKQITPRKNYEFPSKRNNNSIHNFSKGPVKDSSKQHNQSKDFMTSSLIVTPTFTKMIKKQPFQTPSSPILNQQKRGLQNIGNTCYINSILQCLFHIPFFNEYFQKQKYLQIQKINLNQGKGIAKKYRQLFLAVMKGIGNQDQKISTCGLKLALSQQCCLFLDWEQEDAHQFMRKLLDFMHQQLNKGIKNSPYRTLKTTKEKSVSSLANEYFNYYLKRDDSFIYESFGGQFYNKVKCINCKNQSLTFDNSLDVSLSMGNGKFHIQNMLEDFFNDQKLSDYYKCQKCNQTNKNSLKTTKIWRYPQIFIVHLKRSQYGKKNQDLIRMPIDMLNLKNCISSENEKCAGKQPIYSLKGVVCHRGSIQAGHYWSVVREYWQWYQLDDQKVKKIGESQIKRDFQITGSSEAYIMFYTLMNK